MIPVAEPFISNKELEYATDAIKSTWISSKGKYIEKFEEKFADFCGVKHALSCNNGTSALHLALLALDIKPGDEVIIPTLTYIATANAIKYIGAKPVFVDSNEQDWQVDVDKIEERINTNTKAIIAVHLYGIPNNMDKIIEIAKKHDLYVIEDCAEALGAEHNSKKVGSIGDIGCFSFFGNKIITTGEGGMCVTNNEQSAEKIKLFKNQGMSSTQRYFHPVIGFNYRMTNIQAAIGLAQLEKINQILKIRELIGELYNEKLKNIPSINFFQKPLGANYNHVYWMYCITSEKKQEIAEKLKQKQIETRPFFIPVHKMPPYDAGEIFPVAEQLSEQGINLPCYPNMTNEDVERICEVIKEAVN